MSISAIYFHLNENTIQLKIKSYDEIDAKYVAGDLIHSIGSILSFYTLVPIELNGTRNPFPWPINHKLYLPKDAIKIIDGLLEREYNPESNTTLFESAVAYFAQGLAFENILTENPFRSTYVKWTENAIVSYMSCLEVISFK